MPRRRTGVGRWLAAGIVTATIGLSTLASVVSAQPRRVARPPVAARPKASASAGGDNLYEGPAPGASASAAAAAAAASGSSGPVPAPAALAPGGGPLSPLNPAPSEFSDGGIAAAAPPATVDYDRLLADVAALRARVAAVSDTLYKSKVAISLETSGDHGRIVGLSISIDDGVVWTSPASFRADDATTIYEHSVAPGHHAITVDVERRDDRDDTFRSAQRSRFVVDVPTDQRLAVALRLWDDSSMGGDFKSDRKGQYELRVRMRAEAQAVGH